ncbi:CC178 protein, partial [Glaucidium brasilianum]|nr:CC178 protein [Glaucidium brasilianum]
TRRQHSCALVKSPLSCINKAINHIQELELKMGKFFQQVHWWLKKANFHKKYLKYIFKDGKTLTLKQETEALLLEVTELIKRLKADREEAENALELEKQRRKKLGMKIDCMSLWRLQEFPAAVKKRYSHFVVLIIFLTEYEMCTQDTLELQWHFDCKSHQLQQVQSQIFNIETVNRKIQEDIDFMKKHSPLLEEKLNLEGKAVKDVLLAYEKVNAN